jgi:hypothetical protein
MKPSIFSLILILPFLGLTSWLPAQNRLDDLKKVLTSMGDSPDLYFEFELFYFEEGNPKAVDSLSGVYQRSGLNKVYARTGSSESISVQHLKLTIDNENKLMALSNEEENQQMNTLFNASELKKYIEYQQVSWKEFETGDQFIGLSIYNPKEPQNSLWLKYDPKSYFLHDAGITIPDPQSTPLEPSNKKVSVYIKYKDIQIAQKPFVYTIDQYVKRTGKKYIPTGRFKAFKMI